MPFKLQVDASQVGAGAVLLQTGENGLDYPVSFFSRKFNTYQKEALSLIWALQFFDVYVGEECPWRCFLITILLHSCIPNSRRVRA